MGKISDALNKVTREREQQADFQRRSVVAKAKQELAKNKSENKLERDTDITKLSLKEKIRIYTSD